MCSSDLLDGIFMTKAYAWTFTSPLRKIYYNITTTSISVFVALVIGTIQLVGVLSTKTDIEKLPVFDVIAAIDLGGVGYFIVAAFVAAWVVSVAIWKLGNYETRYSQGIEETAHTHDHLDLHN